MLYLDYLFGVVGIYFEKIKFYFVFFELDYNIICIVYIILKKIKLINL